MDAGRDAEARLDHAAEHHAEAERTRRRRHPHRLAHAARLRELDVDAVRALGARRDVRKRVAVLVDVDRHRRGRSQLRPAGVAGRQRLLAVLDSELCELRQRVERLVERPVLVDVDLQRQRGSLADGAHALDVEAVPRAELQLQAPEAASRPLRRAAPCRRGRRARSSTRSAAPHAAARAADRGERPPASRRGRGAPHRGQPAPRTRRGGSRAGDLVERPGIVADACGRFLEPRETRVDRLLVAIDRSRLAVARQPSLPDLDLDDVGRVLRLARDPERLGEHERLPARRKLHAAEHMD